MRRARAVKVGILGAAVAITGVTSGCVYNTPSPGAGSVFSDVATVSKNDVWAVGTENPDSNAARSLIEHFDGRNWTVVAPPSTAGPTLSSVTAVSATDVWAVGGGHTLHWDGRTWSATADPAGLQVEKVEHGHGGLVMALGLNTSTNKFEVLARTAGSWQPIANATPPLPTSGRSCDVWLQINALTLLTTNDIWVAGDTSNNRFTYTSACPYAAHWNGSTWTTYAPPNPTGDAESFLGAISARTDGTVWAVGTGHESEPQFGFDFYDGFAVRWNGSSWQSLCNFGCFAANFEDIDATGANVWVVGIDTLVETQYNFMHIYRWVGNGWTAQTTQVIPPTSPNGFPFAGLYSVSVRGGIVVSAGSFQAPHRLNPLIDIRNDN